MPGLGVTDEGEPVSGVTGSDREWRDLHIVRAREACERTGSAQRVFPGGLAKNAAQLRNRFGARGRSGQGGGT